MFDDLSRDFNHQCRHQKRKEPPLVLTGRLPEYAGNPKGTRAMNVIGHLSRGLHLHAGVIAQKHCSRSERRRQQYDKLVCCEWWRARLFEILKFLRYGNKPLANLFFRLAPILEFGGLYANVVRDLAVLVGMFFVLIHRTVLISLGSLSAEKRDKLNVKRRSVSIQFGRAIGGQEHPQSVSRNAQTPTHASHGQEDLNRSFHANSSTRGFSPCNNRNCASLASALGLLAALA